MVIGQSEEDEFVTVKQGFIQVPCYDVVLPNLDIESAYGHLINAIDVNRPNDYVSNAEHKLSDSFVIVIERKDYANVYWTMIELYNAFLSARMFSHNPSQTCVLLLDVHPKGKLDEIWNMVFRTVVRVKDIKDHEWNFRNLVFGIDTYSGPITTEMESLPFISEFQEAIFHANALPPPTKTACSLANQYINITLILRHNYVAHARNPTGKIKRKLANEGEIISYIKSVMPFAKLTAVQLEDLNVENQVELIYYTDILIGVHGAGLGHVILMRPGSSLIELFPTSYFFFRNRHFENLARWVGIHYRSWYNWDMFFTDSEWMYVSPNEVVQLVQEMATKMCSSISRS
ncbi:beta-1,2-xylosyltransferase-like [Pecten maximus]|uniref:beta-1,2-xylosyltransferase-like n=1 Tax=Pecten maximus TaxID=6579 RepID=UPI001457F262|nr:beta-1,2-xylosyltransferase-like [Pecten maximus]